MSGTYAATWQQKLAGDFPPLNEMSVNKVDKELEWLGWQGQFGPVGQQAVIMEQHTLKIVNNYWNIKIAFYLETSGG